MCHCMSPIFVVTCVLHYYFRGGTTALLALGFRQTTWLLGTGTHIAVFSGGTSALALGSLRPLGTYGTGSHHNAMPTAFLRCFSIGAIFRWIYHEILLERRPWTSDSSSHGRVRRRIKIYNTCSFLTARRNNYVVCTTLAPSYLARRDEHCTCPVHTYIHRVHITHGPRILYCQM